MNTVAARRRPMMSVDVFTDVAYKGNPVAVVLDAEGLDEASMQAFARWTNLSETTFVLPPSETARAQGADYRLRIFSPAGEMDFAGHPTLGSCHAWLAHGGQAQNAQRIVQECAAGLVAIQRSSQGLAFAAPTVQMLAVPNGLTRIYESLQLDAAHVQAIAMLDVGTPWLCIQVDTADTLLALQPTISALQALSDLFEQDVGIGLCALRRHEQAQLEVRAFTLSGYEDPVTGSLNACLADWLCTRNEIQAPYLALQGRSVGRNGRIHIARDAQQQLWVGGQCVLCIQGTVLL